MSSERSERMNYRLSEMSGGTDQLYTSCSTPRPSQLSEHTTLKPFPVNGVILFTIFILTLLISVSLHSVSVTSE